MLSELGRELFFPKGILTQTAEAREKAHLFDATIGIAREGGQAMNLPAIMSLVNGLTPDQVLDYAPSTGNPALRRRWLDDMRDQEPVARGQDGQPARWSPCGITHGLTIAGELFVDPGTWSSSLTSSGATTGWCTPPGRGAEIRTFPFFDGSGGFDIGACDQRALEDPGREG